MTKWKCNQEYLRWLKNLIYDKHFTQYSTLLDHLHKVEFTYTIPMDGNRAEDGIGLRYRFGRERQYPDAMVAEYLDILPCSILEMMVALAVRFEDNTMSDPDMGDRTSQWFWEMIFNLDLSRMTDDHFNEDYVNSCILTLLDHEYSRNGSGGLFTVHNKDIDMRNTEIWYQACYYFSELSDLD